MRPLILGLVSCLAATTAAAQATTTVKLWLEDPKDSATVDAPAGWATVDMSGSPGVARSVNGVPSLVCGGGQTTFKELLDRPTDADLLDEMIARPADIAAEISDAPIGRIKILGSKRITGPNGEAGAQFWADLSAVEDQPPLMVVSALRFSNGKVGGFICGSMPGARLPSREIIDEALRMGASIRPPK